MAAVAYVLHLSALRMGDVGVVGGKNVSLGEVIGHLSGAGVRVIGGFAKTAHAYREFLEQSGLAPAYPAALGNAQRGQHECAGQYGK